MTIDTGTLVQVGTSLLALIISLVAVIGRRAEGGVKETLGRIEVTLTALAVSIEGLKVADHSTDKEVARQGDRIENLERSQHGQDSKLASLEDGLQKHRSVVGDFLQNKLDGWKKDVLREADELYMRRRRRG